MNPQISPAMKQRVGICLDILDVHWDRLRRCEPGTLMATYNQCLNDVVFNEAGIDYTVGDFLQRTLPAWKVNEWDSYRMYPPTYFPLKDPNNPQHIQDRFVEDEFDYDEIKGRQLKDY